MMTQFGRLLFAEYLSSGGVQALSFAYSWADENLQILSSNTAILVEISTRITEFEERIK